MNQLHNNRNYYVSYKKYSHLTLSERKIIQTYYYKDYSYSQIALKIKRFKSTICYEIKRHSKLNHLLSTI